MAEPKTVQIRDMDPDLWKSFKKLTTANDTNIQTVVKELVREWVRENSTVQQQG